MDAQAVVGPQAQSQGAATFLRAGSAGEQVMLEGNGKYYELSRLGYVYTSRTGATPAAIPIFSTATNSPTLWNPASSKRWVVPLFANMTLAAGASIPDSGFQIACTTLAGDLSGAAGLAFPTFTNIVGTSNLLGSGNTPLSKFAHGTITFTTQPTVIMDLGLAQFTLGSAASAGFASMSYAFDGSLILMPGTAVSLVAQVASATTWNVSIIYAEIPVPVGM